MARRKPRTIAVGGNDYTVVLGEKLQVMKKNRIVDAYGFVAYDKQEIHIDKGVPEDARMQTLLHEILHAISNQYDVKLNEHTVHVTSQCLFDVLYNNNLLSEEAWKLVE